MPTIAPSTPLNSVCQICNNLIYKLLEERKLHFSVVILCEDIYLLNELNFILSR